MKKMQALVSKRNIKCSKNFNTLRTVSLSFIPSGPDEKLVVECHVDDKGGHVNGTLLLNQGELQTGPTFNK
jgi:hypothetical protein